MISGGSTTLTVYTYGLQELSYTGAGAFASQIDYYSLAGHLISSTNSTTTTYDLTALALSALTTLSASTALGEQTYGPQIVRPAGVQRISTQKRGQPVCRL